MIRAAAAVFVVGAIAVAILALAGDPGRASVIWLGWRADMTAAAAALIILIGALIATIAWQTLLWILAAPRRAALARVESRRRQALEALTRGFIAVAAGDGSEARRLAQKAAGLADDASGLVQVLAAQAAEAAGDDAAARAAYATMLNTPDTRLAGHRGLMLLANARGERDTALRHAQEAFSESRSSRWAWRALLESRLEAAQWTEGLDLVRSAHDRNIVSPLTAERARAALLAALAAQLEHAPEPKARSRALESAIEAAKLQPGFAPGVVMAARLLAADNKTGRAQATLESAWKVAPHPALWLAYRDLKTAETPHQRAQRLSMLAAQNPGHRESRILYVEQALIAGDAAGARDTLGTLDGEALTARLAGLHARVALSLGKPDEARVWRAQGMNAPQEPDWSDLDPEGRAFAYHAADWARLVTTFAETGELIHPRFERRERGLSELPQLPIAYVDSATFITTDGGAPVLYPIDDEAYAEDAAALSPDLAPATPRRTPARRRSAGAPRPAK